MEERGPAKENVLNPTVLRLGFVSFLADVAGDMLYPIIPLFLTTVLGASMASVGLVEGCAEATASVLKLLSGAWSDRTGARKPLVVAGYVIAALAKPIIGVAGAWPTVLLARSLDRLGKGLRTSPRDALLAEAVSERSRGRVFGWHRAMDSAGASLGPLLALLYLRLRPGDLRSIFFVALVPGLAAAALTMTVREKKGRPRREGALFPRWREMPGAFRFYLFAWGLFSLANSSDVFLLLRAKQAGFDLSGTVLLYCLYNVLYAALSPFLAGLSDRLGRRAVLAGGLAVFAAVYVGFALAAERWQFWLFFAVYGLYMAATDGAGKAFAVDLVPADRKATALGAFGMVTGLCALFASFVAGELWDRAGAGAPFLCGAGGAALAIPLILAVRPRGAG